MRSSCSAIITLAWLILSSVIADAGGLSVVPSAPAKEEKALAELGRKLFFDPRLSATKKISCASCHRLNGAGDLLASGDDGQPVSIGVNGLMAARNAPTVWNSGLRRALFWDGRASTLEEQAGGPLLNSREMALPDRAAAVAAVAGVAGYRAEFRAVFGTNAEDGKISFDQITRAIAAFERTLLTPDSEFDRFQKGDLKSLSPAADRGWKQFQAQGCIACHGAPTFQGEEYFIRFPTHDGRELHAKYGFLKDEGRFSVTGQFQDMNLWRVPSLRNVAITAPYFHNGAVADLSEAVRVMGRAQLGRTLADDVVADIVEFLKSLTGKVIPENAPPLPP